MHEFKAEIAKPNPQNRPSTLIEVLGITCRLQLRILLTIVFLQMLM